MRLFSTVCTGMVSAVRACIVKSVRTVLSALVLLAALVASATTPVFAAHRICVTKQHDCGRTATIRPCCCGEQSNTTDQSSPVSPQFDLSRIHVSIDTPFVAAVQPDLSPIAGRAHASPPRFNRVDLPTLFATLLI